MVQWVSRYRWPVRSVLMRLMKSSVLMNLQTRLESGVNRFLISVHSEWTRFSYYPALFRKNKCCLFSGFFLSAFSNLNQLLTKVPVYEVVYAHLTYNIAFHKQRVKITYVLNETQFSGIVVVEWTSVNYDMVFCQ